MINRTKVKSAHRKSHQEYNIHGARLSRRAFLGASGALMVTLATGPKPALAQGQPRNSLNATAPTSWIEIQADSSVVIRTGKCDFGQSSIYTAYRQIVAEELCVPVETITTVISGDTDRTPDGGGTYSMLRGNVLNLRKVAAYTREAVLELAAESFAVPRDKVTIVDGVIAGGGHQSSYGNIVARQSLSLEIPVEGELTSMFGLTVTGEPPLKDPSQYKIVGQSLKNPIVRPKVSGETTWVGDVKLPGMLHARVIHPATLGSTLIKPGQFDGAQYPGAQLVVIKNLLAVVSADEWEAVRAAMTVANTTRWSEWQGLPGSDALEEHLRNRVDWGEVTSVPATSAASQGNVDTEASQYHTASYFVPFQKHAPIGPTVSLADIKDGQVTVHTHSQNPQRLKMMIAKMLGESEDAVVIRTYPGPGHFGRSNGGTAGSEDQAVLLARKLKRPVRVQWMRHDDMQWSTQSSAMQSDIRIGLNEAGSIASYQAVHSGPPMQDDRLLGAILAGLPTILPPTPENPSSVHTTRLHISDRWVYSGVENVSETARGTFQIGERESPIKVGLRDHSMRTPIQFQQNFPREMAITEAAALAGKDALQFRLEHTHDPRFRALLERLRAESDWETRPSPTKPVDSDQSVLRGRGVSIMFRDYGYWACAANIAVTPQSGAVRVERITLMCDPGIVVNPLQLRRQAEAGCLMGVSQALHEEVSFDQGQITSTHWGSYPILTMAEAPELKVVVAPFQGAKVYGQGSEGANALVPSAITSAFLDATGRPIRRLPLRPEYVVSVLS